MSKKISTELATEDLLQLLQSTPENIIIETEDDIYNFISFYNIQSGENKIHRKILQKLYMKWSKNPVNHKTFVKRFGSYFESIALHYNINESRSEERRVGKECRL